MRQFLVYDLGGTFIKYALMDEEYQVLDQGRVPAELDDLDRLLTVMKAIADGYAGRYEGAAVSLPGRIDTRCGMAYTGGQYGRIIENLPFAKLLEETLGCRVVIANDGKCAVKAEAACGSLKDIANGAVMVLGTGTGGGIILDHRVVMGESGGAGEFSIIAADFARVAHGGFKQGDFSLLFAGYGSTTGLITLYAEKKNLPAAQVISTVSGEDFFRAYDQGEPEAIETLRQFGINTAVGISIIQSVLDLRRYAIGGGISARCEVTESIRNGVEQIFGSSEFPLPFSKPEIVCCKYRNNANLIGALGFYLE